MRIYYTAAPHGIQDRKESRVPWGIRLGNWKGFRTTQLFSGCKFSHLHFLFPLPCPVSPCRLALCESPLHAWPLITVIASHSIRPWSSNDHLAPDPQPVSLSSNSQEKNNQTCLVHGSGVHLLSNQGGLGLFSINIGTKGPGLVL